MHRVVAVIYPQSHWFGPDDLLLFAVWRYDAALFQHSNTALNFKTVPSSICHHVCGMHLYGSYTMDVRESHFVICFAEAW